MNSDGGFGDTVAVSHLWCLLYTDSVDPDRGRPAASNSLRDARDRQIAELGLGALTEQALGHRDRDGHLGCVGVLEGEGERTLYSP